MILTALLASPRADELRQDDVHDIRTIEGGTATIHVKGKGPNERSVSIEAELLSVIETYLDSRAGSISRRRKAQASSPRSHSSGVLDLGRYPEIGIVRPRIQR